MSLPSVKMTKDIKSIRDGYVSSKTECGFMTFLAMTRNEMVRIQDLIQYITIYCIRPLCLPLF